MHSGRPAYDKIMGYITKAKESGGEILIGGTGAIFCPFRFFSVATDVIPRR